jgi:hypothetical protein
MKSDDLPRYLIDNGCILEREGKNHTLFYNQDTNKSATVPRHKEVNTFTQKLFVKTLALRLYKLNK